MIRKLSTDGAYYIEDNGKGVVRYDEGVIDLLYIENKHITLAKPLEKLTLSIVLDFIFSLEDMQDYTFEKIKLSGMNKKDITDYIFFNYFNILEQWKKGMLKRRIDNMKLTEKQKEDIKKACIVEYQNDIKERKKKGQFFTPPELIIKMIEKFDNLDGTFFDPCGGSGNLLVGLIMSGVAPENIYYNELDINEFNAGKKRLMDLGVPEDHFTNFDVLSKEFEEYYNNEV